MNMQRSSEHIVPIAAGGPSHVSTNQFANYLPDEILLEVLNYFPKGAESQGQLAKFCSVSRQWYDVGIERLYEAPFISGKAYDLFYATVCPSKNLHIKRSDLAGLVKVLDFSHLVHQGSKAQTARLLSRTQQSLLTFVAPQASFAINCWASLSKCHKLRVLDLSLVSECISYQSLTQTLRQLPELTELYLPRCSSRYDYNDTKGIGTSVKWPLQLQHLTLSGSVHGKLMWDMVVQPETFPRTIRSIALSHCPKVSADEIRKLLKSLGDLVTHVELVGLPAVSQGRMNGILQWAPKLKNLTIATDYIDMNFGHMPDKFKASMWKLAQPLESLTLATSGQRDVDPSRAFAAVDLFSLIDERFLGRMRFISVAQSTGWAAKDDGAEVEALEMLLHELDKENWDMRRWHYEEFLGRYEGVSWGHWALSPKGRTMRAKLRLLKDM
ncbi:hypothetical protein BU24DRAFT_417573 [Aaosphaeria arxii CBS 175.79]|uniref:Uncharacterized protein n=1 Tax=Aaosphaeria arxii CBS 175.79 TaxID=1450172 RepID=A0A6A5Y8J8_9PLEO|nr:uncharacterized protein BU24DRAFT_417573 [Aaosphaeria arxii CBS 175.79]KAF2021922.1 hypothetical protein BU24DRAFT_417573 [Aaosphaeria arxii CBS 175.79]